MEEEILMIARQGVCDRERDFLIIPAQTIVRAYPDFFLKYGNSFIPCKRKPHPERDTVIHIPESLYRNPNKQPPETHSEGAQSDFFIEPAPTPPKEEEAAKNPSQEPIPEPVMFPTVWRSVGTERVVIGEEKQEADKAERKKTTSAKKKTTGRKKKPARKGTGKKS